MLHDSTKCIGQMKWSRPSYNNTVNAVTIVASFVTQLFAIEAAACLMARDAEVKFVEAE